MYVFSLRLKIARGSDSWGKFIPPPVYQDCTDSSCGFSFNFKGWWVKSSFVDWILLYCKCAYSMTKKCKGVYMNLYSAILKAMLNRGENKCTIFGSDISSFFKGSLKS